jgi:short-subunit dehydrogenase involved in D-alanine esterification of teichoic acids
MVNQMADERKTVLITGCAPGGIGHSLATNFHEAGTIGASIHIFVVANI